MVKCNLKLGEGIIWDHKNLNLFWVEMIEPSSIYKWDYKTKKTKQFLMPEMVTALSMIDKFELLVACKKSISIYNYKTNLFKKLIDIENDIPYNRLNDGGTDAHGRFWFGTMQNTITSDGRLLPIRKKTGAIYVLDKNINLKQIEKDLSCTNTFVWNNENNLMYFTDSTSKKMFKYKFDLLNAKLYEKKIFAEIKDNATPDGSAIDIEDHLWTCCYGSGKIIRFKPNSEIKSVYNVPALGVTNCTFGGENMETLYVTSGKINLTKNQLSNYPLSGDLFEIKTGVQGKVDNYFKLN